TKMSEKEDQDGPGDIGDLTENEEYEDDFEKDDCLINEEEKENLGEREKSEKNEEDIEAQVLKVAENFEEMEENSEPLSELDKDVEVRPSNEESLESRSDIKQGDHVSDMDNADSESSIQESKLEKQQELGEEEDEEIKRYILEKIEEANKQLENQGPEEENRERKLKFKDQLVDFEVPPVEDAEVCKPDLARGDDVSNSLSRLCISNELGHENPSLSPSVGKAEKDGNILVEKDGKFKLLSSHDIESQGFLPPVSVSFTDIETHCVAPKSSLCRPFGSVSQLKEVPPARTGAQASPEEECVHFPKPPSDPKHPPNSAAHAARGLGRRKTPQRTQSANMPVRGSTYCLSPRQKELQKQIEQRKEKLRKEEEERKREQEEQKRRENEVVFKAWLQKKKKEQVQEEKRIRHAKEQEDLNSKERSRNPDEAFKSWLKKKHQEHMKEKQIEMLRRQTEGTTFFPRTEECNRAFKEWLKRKREEKRAEELAAKETARQLRLEARRAKQMQNIHCIGLDQKCFCFTDRYT
ncbi:CC181 protein, partial [Alcedo cyanopectus]|nr:CC181 protein [Ceyx cyanopectus]